MVVDDANLRLAALLVEFMDADRVWIRAQTFGVKTVAFRKTRPLALDLAWHMEPLGGRGRQSGRVAETRLAAVASQSSWGSLKRVGVMVD